MLGAASVEYIMLSFLSKLLSEIYDDLLPGACQDLRLYTGVFSNSEPSVMYVFGLDPFDSVGYSMFALT